MKKFFFNLLYISVLFLVVTYNFAQENIQTDFPTLISTKYIKGYIEIKFEPINDTTAKYKIYRSKNPILSINELKKSSVIKIINKNEIPFKDKPPADGKYYYAVTTIKNNKEILKLVPLQNTLVFPVSYAQYPESVRIFKIENNKSKVKIYFGPLIKGMKYNLYVSKNIINKESLKVIKPVSEKKAEKNEKIDHFTISLKEGVYYFAITVENSLGVKNDTLITNNNLVKYTFTPEKKQKSLAKTKKEVITTEKPIVKTFNKKEQSIKKSVKSTKKIDIDAKIKWVLKRYFKRGFYNKTIQELKYILKRYNLNDNQKATSYYFIAQCYYYLGKKKRAIKYFILCKDYPYLKTESEGWIDRILNELP